MAVKVSTLSGALFAVAAGTLVWHGVDHAARQQTVFESFSPHSSIRLPQSFAVDDTGYRQNMAPQPEDDAPPKSRILPAGPRTSSEARWFLMEALRDRDVSVDLVGTAALLTGELASNAARHGGEPIAISVRIEEGGLRVSLRDHGPGFDQTDENAQGWGVRLVDSLASEWGVERDGETTEVWFKI